MFGANLRSLSKDYVSVSELSRQLGINRTQFNRYLAGESFPRPDVLARICGFFKVDARMLLEPVEKHHIFRRPDDRTVFARFCRARCKRHPRKHLSQRFLSLLAAQLYGHLAIRGWPRLCQTRGANDLYPGIRGARGYEKSGPALTTQRQRISAAS